jgi:hypothetical protein
MPTALLQNGLQQNPPLNRFKYVAKTYGEKHPDVVLDTFFSLADTVGIENPAREFDAVRRWDRLRSQMIREARSGPFPSPPPVTESSRNRQQREILQQLLQELEDEPRMKQGRESDALWPWLARELVRSKKTGAKITDRSPAWMAWSKEIDGKGSAIALWQRGGYMRVTDPGDADAAFAPGAVVHRSEFDRVNDELEPRLHEGRQRKFPAKGVAIGIDLGQYDISRVLKALEDFEVARRGIPQGEVVYEFDDGWTVQRLREPDQLKVEGEVMQHCVGTYCEAVETGHSIIYSLRDPQGKPHATMETRDKFPHFVQVQGKQNQTPIEAYQKRVAEFAKTVDIDPTMGLTKEEYDQAYAYGEERGDEEWRKASSRINFSLLRASDEYDGEHIDAWDITSETNIKGDPGDWADSELGPDLEEAAEEGANEGWAEAKRELQEAFDDAVSEAAGIIEDELNDGADADEIDVEYIVTQALESSVADAPWGREDTQHAIDEVAAEIEGR